ncbi:HlyD family type I secretion periplasmic adaptor subunit [Lichenicola sp.]|uniref:HlyD family type I secretion periplasmic adaptor subunit n=1 Tax=Lichenicola sp. TaxID=2804529 RepID=UPI003B00C486
MSGTELTTQDSDADRKAIRRRSNNDDMPPALLEFHSPSAAIAAMPPTPSARYITWIVSSMAFAGFMVLALFPIDRVVTATGALVPTVPTIVVQPLETSIVKSIDVREGDVVHKGQVLAHLDPTISNADVGNLRSQSQSYQAQVARLTAEVTGKEYVVDPSNPASNEQEATFLRRKAENVAKMTDYDQQIAGAQSDLVGAQASAAMYAGRVKVASDVHNMRVELQRDQVGSRLNSLSAQDDMMEMERSQLTAQQAATSARNKLNALIAERTEYIENSKAEDYKDLTDAQIKMYDANSSYTKAQLSSRLTTMVADRDAIVLNIAKVSVGSVLNAAQQFMNLMPLDAPLQVEARMQADQAGFVKLGDKANIKFQTFSYIQYGGGLGTVTNISADAFSADDVQAGAASAPANGMTTPGGGQSQPFYRVRIRVDQYTLHDVPKFFKPTPGMVVSADIGVGKRTILQFLLSTVIPTASEGMRDPS